MNHASHLERVAADILHESPVLCEKLGLDGFARLATCSKTLRQTIESALVKDSLSTLDRALETTWESQQEQHKQAVALGWLAAVVLRKAPAMAEEVTKRLFYIPHVPLETAQQLVELGVRISYTQLLAASHSMVAEVEVWVRAQQSRNVHTDIPATVVAVCCREKWVSYVCTSIVDCS
jgi:hypothetical protein